MGERGRAPKPTNVRQLHGDRADRLPKGEPTPAQLQVRCPQWLSTPAKRVWRHYAPDLKRKGVLTAWDVEAFATFCDAAVRRRHAAERLDEEGEVLYLPVKAKDGSFAGWQQKRNQWAFVWKDANETIQRFGARFGLTPSDRAQLDVGGEAGRDEAAALLS
jgi:P27 family predicted phage terminase small subunit